MIAACGIPASAQRVRWCAESRAALGRDSRSLTNQKKVKRLAAAVAGRGPKDKRLLGPVAAYLGVTTKELPRVANRIPDMYSPGKRRPQEELSSLAILPLGRLFVDTTGLAHHRHVKIFTTLSLARNSAR